MHTEVQCQGDVPNREDIGNLSAPWFRLVSQSRVHIASILSVCSLSLQIQMDTCGHVLPIKTVRFRDMLVVMPLEEVDTLADEREGLHVVKAKRMPNVPSADEIAAAICDALRAWCRACVTGHGLSS